MPWQVLPYNSPVPPIHAALLRTGNVLLIAGSATDQDRTLTCSDCSAVWNVSNGTFSQPPIPLDNDGIPYDLFCVGHSFRADGQLMAAGGTLGYNPYRGWWGAVLFNPSTQQWTKVTDMQIGRWYPTLVTLGSGKVLALSGLDQNALLDIYPEIYSGSSGWTTFSQPTSPFPMYAQLFLLSSGKLFYSGAYFENNNGVTPRILTLPSNFGTPITETPLVTGLQAADYGDQAASVLLPPAQDQRVMIIGGGRSDYTTTNRVNIVSNLNASNPSYTTAPPLNYARMHHNAVLLPDRTVFVCNGSATGYNLTTSNLPGEIYNPATNTWTVVEAQNVPRAYHATALLIPDGRVITGGTTPQVAVNELRLEIYRPAYMSQPRPTIGNAPSTVSYGRTITIPTPQAANIKWVSLIRPGAATHSCDTEQRIVDLPINSRTSTSLTTVAVTTNRNLAPPGYYMLFITNDNNIPSVAKWIKLS